MLFEDMHHKTRAPPHQNRWFTAEEQLANTQVHLVIDGGLVLELCPEGWVHKHLAASRCAAMGYDLRAQVHMSLVECRQCSSCVAKDPHISLFSGAGIALTHKQASPHSQAVKKILAYTAS